MIFFVFLFAGISARPCDCCRINSTQSLCGCCVVVFALIDIHRYIIYIQSQVRIISRLPVLLKPCWKTGVLLLSFPTDCSKVLIYHTKMIFVQTQRCILVQLKCMGLWFDLAEHSWGLKAELSYECSVLGQLSIYTIKGGFSSVRPSVRP